MKTAALAAILVMAGGVQMAQAEGARGPETGLPMPRFVSMKATEGNVRRGPSRSHRVDWVYTRKDLPLMITAEYGHWRRVEDRDGVGGWMHYSLLSGVRTAIVEPDMVTLRLTPDPRAPEAARAKAGVVARIDTCERDWCRIRKDGYRGWVEKQALWGVGRSEIID